MTKDNQDEQDDGGMGAEYWDAEYAEWYHETYEDLK